jgi:predicted HTH domain antitoxin
VEIDMPQIVISVPDEFLTSMKANKAKVELEVKRYLAIKYYQEEALTIGKAADLAGMNHMEFELFLSHNQVPISLLDYEDIQADLAKMKNITRPAL